jgi:hypothetical protein
MQVFRYGHPTGWCAPTSGSAGDGPARRAAPGQSCRRRWPPRKSRSAWRRRVRSTTWTPPCALTTYNSSPHMTTSAIQSSVGSRIHAASAPIPPMPRLPKPVPIAYRSWRSMTAIAAALRSWPSVVRSGPARSSPVSASTKAYRAAPAVARQSSRPSCSASRLGDHWRGSTRRPGTGRARSSRCHSRTFWSSHAPTTSVLSPIARTATSQTGPSCPLRPSVQRRPVGVG